MRVCPFLPAFHVDWIVYIYIYTLVLIILRVSLLVYDSFPLLDLVSSPCTRISIVFITRVCVCVAVCFTPCGVCPRAFHCRSRDSSTCLGKAMRFDGHIGSLMLTDAHWNSCHAITAFVCFHLSISPCTRVCVLACLSVGLFVRLSASALLCLIYSELVQVKLIQTQQSSSSRWRARARSAQCAKLIVVFSCTDSTTLQGGNTRGRAAPSTMQPEILPVTRLSQITTLN